MPGTVAQRRSARATSAPHGAEARKALADRIQKIRRHTELRIEDVGDRMTTAPPEIGSMSRDAFTQVLYGKAGASLQTLRTIAYGLGVDAWEQLPEYRAAVIRQALDPAIVGPEQMEANLELIVGGRDAELRRSLGEISPEDEVAQRALDVLRRAAQQETQASPRTPSAAKSKHRRGQAS